MADLITDTGDCSRLLKYLADTIPAGQHPAPHAEWVGVRLDVVKTAIDHIKWLEKESEDGRLQCLSAAKQTKVAMAQARVAIGHLQAVLNTARTHPEQQAADTAARDWLESIGSEPT